MLKPYHYAVMRVGIISPEREGLFVATAFVHTEFEQPTVPFRLRIALGSLSTVPAVVTFEKTFPVRHRRRSCVLCGDVEVWEWM